MFARDPPRFLSPEEVFPAAADAYCATRIS